MSLNSDSAFRKVSNSLVVGLGCGLSLFTVLIALVPFDCGSGFDCGGVSQGPYGQLFGIPVGLYAMLLWISLYLFEGPPALLAKALLVGGTVVFLYLQAAVLHKFCPYCVAHAILCLLQIPLFKVTQPRPSIGILCIFTAVAVITGVERWQTYQPATPTEEAEKQASQPPISSGLESPLLESTAPEGTAYLQGIDLPTALPLKWLSPNLFKKRAIIVDLFCPKCLILLHSLSKLDSDTNRIAPIIWKTNERSVDATRFFVAAVLSDNELQKGFRKAFNLLGKDRSWYHNSDPSVIHNLLLAEFPDLDAFIDTADELLSDHAAFVEKAGLTISPSLYADGKIYRGFTITDASEPIR